MCCNSFQNVKWSPSDAVSYTHLDVYKRQEYISQTLQNVFDFMEAAFGDSQEMVAFITELNANFYSIWFIRENGSDQYYLSLIHIL